jgi:hypothetical protein
MIPNGRVKHAFQVTTPSDPTEDKQNVCVTVHDINTPVFRKRSQPAPSVSWQLPPIGASVAPLKRRLRTFCEERDVSGLASTCVQPRPEHRLATVLYLVAGDARWLGAAPGPCGSTDLLDQKDMSPLLV